MVRVSVIVTARARVIVRVRVRLMSLPAVTRSCFVLMSFGPRVGYGYG